MVMSFIRRERLELKSHAGDQISTWLDKRFLYFCWSSISDQASGKNLLLIMSPEKRLWEDVPG